MLNNTITSLWLRLQDVRDREEGQGLVEYALILALVSVISIAVLTLVGTDIRDVLQAVADVLPTAAPAAP